MPFIKLHWIFIYVPFVPLDWIFYLYICHLFAIDWIFIHLPFVPLHWIFIHLPFVSLDWIFYLYICHLLQLIEYLYICHLFYFIEYLCICHLFHFIEYLYICYLFHLQDTKLPDPSSICFEELTVNIKKKIVRFNITFSANDIARFNIIFSAIVLSNKQLTLSYHFLLVVFYLTWIHTLICRKRSFS